LREGVEGDKHAPTFGVGVLNSLRGGFGVEVQAGKVPGVGIVAEADVNRIRPMIDSGFQRG
jgi:hypothetical protein